MPSLISAVVVDIEGTTTPISFVHDTLFPYARKMLPEFVRSGHSDPAVAAELASVRQAAPGEDPLTVLLGWMDGDAKHTALKTLQGLIWHQGYADGTLKGVLYSDVAPCLGRWHSDGLRLFVYSSGSETAQRLLFGHSDAGDLSKLFTGFFDTRIGPKRAPQSYSTVATQIGLEPQAILFLSDTEAELDAAAAAGLAVCQLVRAQDGTLASDHHSIATDFPEVEKLFSLSPRLV